MIIKKHLKTTTIGARLRKVVDGISINQRSIEQKLNQSIVRYLGNTSKITGIELQELHVVIHAPSSVKLYHLDKSLCEIEGDEFLTLLGHPPFLSAIIESRIDDALSVLAEKNHISKQNLRLRFYVAKGGVDVTICNGHERYAQISLLEFLRYF